MESLSSLYQDHLATLQQRTREISQRQQLDGLLIHAGDPIGRFLDDHDSRLKLIPISKPGCRSLAYRMLAMGGRGKQAETLVLPAGRLLISRGIVAG